MDKDEPQKKNKIEFKKLGIILDGYDEPQALKEGAVAILRYTHINDYLLIEKGSFKMEKLDDKKYEVSVMAHCPINLDKYDFEALN